MSTQKKILYAFVIVLAVIGLLSLLPAPGGANDAFVSSDAAREAMEPEAVERAANYSSFSSTNYYSAWDWVRPTQPTTASLGEPTVARWSSWKSGAWCSWFGKAC